MSVVVLQDEIVHYEVLGRGRPLIFLHGWVGSWRYWIPTMQAASISFRTYALDLWGFGDTAKNASYYTLDQQLNLLDLFLQEMGIGKVALIGHGLGAIVGLLYASHYPRFVDRAMVVGFPNGAYELNPRMKEANPADLADWLLGRTSESEAARVEAPKADPLAIQLSLSHIERMDLSQLIYASSLPCLMVYGQNDPVLIGSGTEQNNGLPENIHKIVFEQSGHYPMLDEASKFNRLMADFLSLGSGESPRSLQLKEEWKRRVR